MQAKGSYVLFVLFLLSIGLTSFYIYKFSSLSFAVLRADVAYQEKINVSAELHRFKFTKHEAVLDFKRSYLSWVRADISQRFERENAFEYTVRDIKLSISWQAYEMVLAVIYILVWTFLLLKQMGASALVSTIDAVALQAIQEPWLKSAKAIWGFFKVKVDLFCLWRFFPHAVMIILAVLFFIFCILRQILFSYRLTIDIPIWYGFFLDISVFFTVILGSICSLTLLKGVSSYSDARRSTLMRIGGGALTIGIGALVATRLPKLKKFGHIPSPRFKTKKIGRVWKVNLSTGLYRHSKSKNFYYVDRENMLRSDGLVNAIHLKPESTISQSDFEFLPILTANSYFEHHAFHLFEKRKYMDALGTLEMGCRYQLYRLQKSDGFAPNTRIFKLYFGLCRKYRLRHHTDRVRDEINELQLRSILAPGNQRWMFSRAWCFKQRWFSRTKYNKHLIPVRL